MRGATEDSFRVRPDGSVIEHHTNRMPDGMMIRTFTDITPLKEQEHRLDDQHRLLTATLGNMDQGMLVLDSDLRIQLWNERLLELLHAAGRHCGRSAPTLADMIAAMRRHQGSAG